MKLLIFILISLTSLSFSNGYSNTIDAIEKSTEISRNSFTDKDLLTQLYLREFKIKSFQAYREENPEIAIWALNNFARLLRRKPLFEVSIMQKRDMQIDLALTYGRLAIVYKHINKDFLYKEYIQKSLDLTKALRIIDQNDAKEENLLNLIRRIDDSTKIKEY